MPADVEGALLNFKTSSKLRRSRWYQSDPPFFRGLIRFLLGMRPLEISSLQVFGLKNRSADTKNCPKLIIPSRPICSSRLISGISYLGKMGLVNMI